MLLIFLLYKYHVIDNLFVKLQLVEENEISDKTGDYWAITGWANTLQKLNYKADIVFFGSSNIMYSDFRTYFPDKQIVNLGYPGDTTMGMMRRMNMLRAVNPNKIFVYGGFNGLANQSLEEFSQHYKVLVDSVQHTCPKADIILLSILPINHVQFDRLSNEKIRRANECIYRISKEKRLSFVDLFSLYCFKGELPDELTWDGLHLNSEAYDRWADAIRKYVYN